MSGNFQWHAPERTSRSVIRSRVGNRNKRVQMHGSATRREALRLGVKVIGLLTLASCQRSQTPTAEAIEEVKLPAELPVERFDSETKGDAGWTTVEGRWVVGPMAHGPCSRRRRSHAGMARRQAVPRPPRCAVQGRSRRTVDESRFDYGLR